MPARLLMAISILESPFIKHPKPWWLPLLSLFLTLYGILILGWNLRPIIFMFWWEVILMTGAALIRMLFALDHRPPTALLLTKAGLLFGGTIMGGAMIMLAVTFSFKAFEGGDYSGFSNIAIQTRTMTAAYIIGLVLHYFANGRYKAANPGEELFKTLIHLLILLAILMAITMHFLPAHPSWNQSLWVGVAVVVVKFLVDWRFVKLLK